MARADIPLSSSTLIFLTSSSCTVVVTKNVYQRKGIINATCGIDRSWRETAASLEAGKDKIDNDHERPASVEMELATRKGQGTIINLKRFEDRNVPAPYCRGCR